MHPLDGCRLKLDRAKFQIGKFKLEEDEYFRNVHCRIVKAEYDKQNGNDIYRIKMDGNAPSPRLGVDVGEIAHNLRSSLNYLVYQLALLNASSEIVERDKKLQFPIYLCENDSKESRKIRTSLLNSIHIQTIEMLQPYNKSPLLKTVDLAERNGTKSPLYWLEEINNADKHRIIQIVGVRTAGFATSYWGTQTDAFIGGTFDILENGDKFGEAPHDLNVNIQIRPLLAFANGCDAIIKQPIYLVLDLIATTVLEIIQLFESEFTH